VYDRKTVRRRRAVLGLLVAGSLILITASFGDGLRSIERGALAVFGPVQDGASRVLEPFRDAFGWLGDTFDAKSELEDLRAERDALRRQLVDERGAARENRELRALVKMDQRLSLEEQGAVTARVSGRSPTVWYSTVTVNKGTRDGVREGQPVVNGAGLVGRVRRVQGGNAQVLLITDGDSGVTAKVTESGASGIVETAVGDPNDLRLEFLGRNDRPREDQTVVTAGSTSERLKESRYPPDIPIGRITRVDEDEGTVHVRPFADLRELEFVQILTEPAL
jgi:rod shape-determining protein MreC